MASQADSTDQLRRIGRIAQKHVRGFRRFERLPGQNNLVVRVHGDAGTVIIKLGQPGETAAMAREVHVLRWLGGTEVPVAGLLTADASGAEFGAPYCLLEDKGLETLAHLSRGEGLGLFEQMGFHAATFHRLTWDCDVISQLAVPGVAKIARDASAIVAWAEREQILDEVMQSRLRTLEFAEFGGMQLCHGDLSPVQCVVRENRMTAVLDWQTAWHGNPWFDVAITTVYVELAGGSEAVAAFRRGYTRARPWLEDFDRATAAVRAIQGLAVARWAALRRRAPAARAAMQIALKCI